MPTDAAVASTSPQSKRLRENQNPNIAQSPERAPPAADAPPPSPNGHPPSDESEMPPANVDGNASSSSAPVAVVTGQSGAREAFHQSQQQRIITCNLTLIPPSNIAQHIMHDPQHVLIRFTDHQQKIRLSGIVIVLYSPQPGPPARMYMLVADKDGVAGVTVWGDTVHQLTGTSDVIGRAVNIPGCTMSFYNGKRSLNVPRNLVIHFPETSPHHEWWASKLMEESVTTNKILTMPDHTVANIFAVCAGIRREERTSCKPQHCHDHSNSHMHSQRRAENSGCVDHD